MMRKKLLIIFLVMFVSSVMGQTVGVAPGFTDFGEVQRGSEDAYSIYVVTNAEENFTVSPEFNTALSSTVFDSNLGDPDEASEQDISSFVDFTKQQYTVNPSTERTYELPDGRTVRASKKIDFTMAIPSDVEPGYHFFSVELNPEFPNSGGVSASTVGLSVPRFMFRVPGNAEREIELTDIQGVRTGEERAQIVMQFHNTGTVTTSITRGSANVLNNDQESIGEIRFDGMTLEPGEYGETSAIWRDNNMQGGTYELEGTADYTTGEAYVNGSITFTDVIREEIQVDNPSANDNQSQSEDSLPLWVMALFLVATSTVLYSFDVKPVFIAGIVGFFALAMYIWSSNISNLAILAVLGSGGFLYVYSKW